MDGLINDIQLRINKYKSSDEPSSRVVLFSGGTTYAGHGYLTFTDLCRTESMNQGLGLDNVFPFLSTS